MTYLKKMMTKKEETENKNTANNETNNLNSQTNGNGANNKVTNTNNEIDAPILPQSDETSERGEQEAKRDEEDIMSVDVQKELEAKCDELFGSLMTTIIIDAKKCGKKYKMWIIYNLMS